MSVVITTCLTTALLLIIGSENAIPEEMQINMQYTLANALYNYKENPDIHLQTIRYMIERGVAVNGPCPAINAQMSMIQTAVCYASTEAVEALLEAGATVDEVTPLDTETALVKAVQRQQLDMVNKLLSNGASTESVDSRGSTPTYMAVEIGSHEIAEVLLENGARPDCKKPKGYTPLIEAMLSVDGRMIEILYRYGADFLYSDVNGITPLTWSITVGRTDVALHILNNLDPQIGQLHNGEPELFWAIENNMIDVVDKLLARHYPLSLVDDNGNTGLHFTAKIAKYVPIMERLLVVGSINLEAENNHGDRALHVAVRNTNLAAAKLLLDNGACMNTLNGEGDTVIHIAVKQHNLPILDLLFTKGADIELVNRDGNTALNIAMIGIPDSIMHCLIEGGANVNHADNDGNTPLHMMVKHKESDKVRQLIQHGSDMEVVDTNGMTPFDLALSVEHNDAVVDEFVKIDHNIINRADTMGRTSLHRAAMHGWEEAIRKLLQLGADVDLEDTDGNTPRQLAALNHKQTAIDVLSE